MINSNLKKTEMRKEKSDGSSRCYCHYTRNDYSDSSKNDSIFLTLATPGGVKPNDKMMKEKKK